MKYIKTRHQIYFEIKENSESGNYRSTLFYNIMGVSCHQIYQLYFLKLLIS